MNLVCKNQTRIKEKEKLHISISQEYSTKILSKMLKARTEKYENNYSPQED